MIRLPLTTTRRLNFLSTSWGRRTAIGWNTPHVFSTQVPSSSSNISSSAPPSPVPEIELSPVDSISSRDRVGAGGVLGKLKSYKELSKFQLSSLVVFTTASGYVAAGLPLDPTVMSAACFGTGLCAASAGTFNQMLEKDLDAKMKRTCNRPLPSGKVSLPEAGAFGIATGLAGTGMLYALTNPVVAALGAANIFLYSVPYTISKQHSEINTWVGSIVGAIPPVMGWAAAMNGDILSAEPLALASLLFLWQFPHFFALSWMYRQDYARGNFQMVACNDVSGDRTANLILQYSTILCAFPLITSGMGLTSWMYSVEGTAANAYLMYLAYKFKQDHSNARARKVFLCSLWYLPLLLFGFVYHSRNWKKNKAADPMLLLNVHTGELQDDVEGKDMGLSIGDAVDLMRENLKTLCPHEVLSLSSSSQPAELKNSVDGNGSELQAGHGHLCVKIRTEQAVEEVSQEVVKDVATLATAVSVQKDTAHS